MIIESWLCIMLKRFRMERRGEETKNSKIAIAIAIQKQKRNLKTSLFECTNKFKFSTKLESFSVCISEEDETEELKKEMEI